MAWWWKKGICVVAFLLISNIAAAQKIPVWRIVDGSWSALPAENGYATCEPSDPYSYYCNAGREIVVKVYCKVECPIQFSKTALAVSENIQPNPDGTFTVLHLFQYAECLVTITIVNNSSQPMDMVQVSDRFGGEFGVELISVTQGSVTFDYTGVTEKVHLNWDVGAISPGDTAILLLKVYTDINPGGIQEFTSPTGDTPTELNSGAVLKYYQGGEKFSQESSSILVYAIDNPGTHSTEDPTCTISFNASSFNWYIRKPSIFAAGPIVINFTSDGNMRVGLQFSNFGNLISSDGGTELTAYYGFGAYGQPPDFNDVAAWIPAAELNNQTDWSLYVPEQTGSVWSMWCKIEVKPDNPSSEYSGEGTITFIAQP